MTSFFDLDIAEFARNGEGECPQSITHMRAVQVHMSEIVMRVVTRGRVEVVGPGDSWAFVVGSGKLKLYRRRPITQSHRHNSKVLWKHCPTNSGTSEFGMFRIEMAAIMKGDSNAPRFPWLLM
jgi:hypothetical protein